MCALFLLPFVYSRVLYNFIDVKSEMVTHKMYLISRESVRFASTLSNFIVPINSDLTFIHVMVSIFKIHYPIKFIFDGGGLYFDIVCWREDCFCVGKMSWHSFTQYPAIYLACGILNSLMAMQSWNFTYRNTNNLWFNSSRLAFRLWPFRMQSPQEICQAIKSTLPTICPFAWICPFSQSTFIWAISCRFSTFQKLFVSLRWAL